jgi:hypothetical protein
VPSAVNSERSYYPCQRTSISRIFVQLWLVNDRRHGICTRQSYVLAIDFSTSNSSLFHLFKIFLDWLLLHKYRKAADGMVTVSAATVPIFLRGLVHIWLRTCWLMITKKQALVFIYCSNIYRVFEIFDSHVTNKNRIRSFCSSTRTKVGSSTAIRAETAV